MNRRPLRKLKNWAFLGLSMLATLAGLWYGNAVHVLDSGWQVGLSGRTGKAVVDGATRVGAPWNDCMAMAERGDVRASAAAIKTAMTSLFRSGNQRVCCA